MAGQIIRFLSAKDVRKSLSMDQAIEAVKDAFFQLSTNQAVVPLRLNIEIPEINGNALFMPVYIPKYKQIGLKVVSVFNDNPGQGLPRIHAMVIVMDAANGRPLAVMDGEYITAVRTGAASGVATDLLARKDAQIAAVFGAGVQGRTQLEAVCAVRQIKHAYVFDTIKVKAVEYAQEMSKRLSIPVSVIEDNEVLRQSDIICTATSSHTPVFSDNDLKRGVHINSIGSYKPTDCEIPAETILRSKVVVDSRNSCLSEAGDIIIPLQQGLINEEHIYAEIGEIVAGSKKGRVSEKEITVFKSVGNAVQDLAAASLALNNAQRLNLGTEVSL